MSNRVQDTLTSKEVEKFLDKYYYKGSSRVERVHDKKRQVQGIDVIIDGKTFVDEKCATDYINRPLYTFALEISSVNRNGERYPGWFINENLATTHYLFCYINKCRVDVNPKMEDIMEMEAIYVEKKALLNVFEKENFDYEDLVLTNPKDRSFFINGYKFVRSGQKAERPLNLIFGRERLRVLGRSTIVRP